MIKKFNKLITNTMLLADFVMNIDRYINTWTMMAIALSKIINKIEYSEKANTSDIEDTEQFISSYRYNRSGQDKVN